MIIDKPIIGKRTTIGQAFDQYLEETLPIHTWCLKQEAIRKKGKL